MLKAPAWSVAPIVLNDRAVDAIEYSGRRPPRRRGALLRLLLIVALSLCAVRARAAGHAIPAVARLGAGPRREHDVGVADVCALVVRAWRAGLGCAASSRSHLRASDPVLFVHAASVAAARGMVDDARDDRLRDGAFLPPHIGRRPGDGGPQPPRTGPHRRAGPRRRVGVRGRAAGGRGVSRPLRTPV